jgi:hypothetical protein
MLTYVRPAVAEIERNEAVRIGLAVSAHANPRRSAEAKISNATVTGDVGPTVEFLRSEDIGFKLIALPDRQDPTSLGRDPERSPSGAPSRCERGA